MLSNVVHAIRPAHILVSLSVNMVNLAHILVRQSCKTCSHHSLLVVLKLTSRPVSKVNPSLNGFVVEHSILEDDPRAINGSEFPSLLEDLGLSSFPSDSFCRLSAYSGSMIGSLNIDN
jgi:hypothetical protein